METRFWRGRVARLASKGVAEMKPLVLAGASGASTPALVIAILSASGLVLSLIGRRYADS